MIRVEYSNAAIWKSTSASVANAAQVCRAAFRRWPMSR